MRRTTRTRSTLIATTVAALATPALLPALAGPAAATSVPPAPSGHVRLDVPEVVEPGTRVPITIRVLEMADASAPSGWMRVIVREHDGSFRWRVHIRYTGRKLQLRTPRLTEPGRYDLRVRFKASKRSGTPSGRAFDRIRVYQLEG